MTKHFVALLVIVVLGHVIAPQVNAGRLKIIIATDELDSVVGKDMAISNWRIASKFAANIPRDRMDYIRVPPANFRAASIMDVINNLKVESDDSVFFYYGGHGAYDFRWGTYIMASGDKREYVLFASQIREALEAKKARLSVAIIDCCNAMRPVGVRERGRVAPAPQAPAVIFPIKPLYDQLFFRSSGSILIVSSSPGEYAIVLPQVVVMNDDETPRVSRRYNGSLFSSCFSSGLDALELKNPTASWRDVCKATQALLDVQFMQLCPRGHLVLGTGEVINQSSQNIIAVLDGRAIAVR